MATKDWKKTTNEPSTIKYSKKVLNGRKWISCKRRVARSYERDLSKFRWDVSAMEYVNGSGVKDTFIGTVQTKSEAIKFAKKYMVRN